MSITFYCSSTAYDSETVGKYWVFGIEVSKGYTTRCYSFRVRNPIQLIRRGVKGAG